MFHDSQRVPKRDTSRTVRPNTGQIKRIWIVNPSTRTRQSLSSLLEAIAWKSSHHVVVAAASGMTFGCHRFGGCVVLAVRVVVVVFAITSTVGCLLEKKEKNKHKNKRQFVWQEIRYQPVRFTNLQTSTKIACSQSNTLLNTAGNRPQEATQKLSLEILLHHAWLENTAPSFEQN